MKKLMIMGGGTGGHIFPGLAIADYLSTHHGWKIFWLGTSSRIEADLVYKNNIDIDFINIKGLHGTSWKEKYKISLQILSAVKQARSYINRRKPHIVLGMGGYVSGPGGLAAWSSSIPLIIHEQNSIAGLTNRILSIFSYKILQAFPGAFSNAEVVGNPIKNNILQLPEPHVRFGGRHGPLRILVMGGSQGSKILNNIMPIVTEQLSGMVTVWHLVGKGSGSLESVINAYSKIYKSNVRIMEFLDDISTAYAWADLVISRSGALTVSELAVAGLPAIFVPYKHKDRQQYYNARLLEQIGAAKIIDQSDLTISCLINILRNLDRLTLLKMGQSAKTMGIYNSTEKISKIIITINDKLYG